MDFRPLIPSFQQGVLITTSGLLLYGLLRVIYNVYFHPLARFPGPRSAACTSLWLAYMQLVRGVSLSTLRADLHQKYGKPSTLPSSTSDCGTDPVPGQVILFEWPRMR
jgi:hypothetical protein